MYAQELLNTGWEANQHQEIRFVLVIFTGASRCSYLGLGSDNFAEKSLFSCGLQSCGGNTNSAMKQPSLKTALLGVPFQTNRATEPCWPPCALTHRRAMPKQLLNAQGQC